MTDLQSANVVALRGPTAPPKPTISDLARAHGVSRSTIRRWQTKGWPPGRMPVLVGGHAEIAPASTPTEIVTQNQQVTTYGHPHGQGGGHLQSAGHVHWPPEGGLAARGLAVIAFGLAAAGAVVNGRYYGSLGRTTLDSDLMAILGCFVDAATFVMPTFADRLWESGRRLGSLIAWMVVALCVVLTMIATAGFTSENFGDAQAARTGVWTNAEAAADQRQKAIDLAQRAADTATEARRAECAIRGPRCRDDEAAERAAIAELSKANNTPIVEAPKTSKAGDPGAQMIGSVLHVSEVSVQYARTAGLTMMPALAGLMLWFADAAGCPRKTRRG